MPLDVFLQPKTRWPHQHDDYFEHICAFDDDGYYWFLHPLFETLVQRTGQYIDLYGGAIFNGSLLNELQQTIMTARQLILLQPQVWDVHIGTLVGTSPEKIYSRVYQDKFLQLLEQLEKALKLAEERGWYLIFIGD